MWLRAGLAAALLAGLAGCESSVDRLRTAICRRTLPALVPADANPRLLSVGRGPAPDSVRLDYLTGHQPHRIVCAFDQGAGLTGLVVDQKAVTGGALYLLRRYYLDTPDAEANDPAGSGPGHPTGSP